MYNAKAKRFLAEDIVKGELQNPMTLVAHGYVLGSPFVYVDLDGLKPTVVEVAQIATDIYESNPNKIYTKVLQLYYITSYV